MSRMTSSCSPGTGVQRTSIRWNRPPGRSTMARVHFAARAPGGCRGATAARIRPDSRASPAFSNFMEFLARNPAEPPRTPHPAAPLVEAFPVAMVVHPPDLPQALGPAGVRNPRISTGRSYISWIFRDYYRDPRPADTTPAHHLDHLDAARLRLRRRHERVPEVEMEAIRLVLAGLAIPPESSRR